MVDDWQWHRLRQRYPYAKRPYLQPFPSLIGSLLYTLFVQILYGLCLGEIWALVSLIVWPMLRQCFFVGTDKADLPIPQEEKQLNESMEALDEADETDSLNVVVHTPPRQLSHDHRFSPRNNNKSRNATSKNKKAVLKPTVRFSDTIEPQRNQPTYTSSVLRRRNGTATQPSTKSVTFSEDASGAIRTTEHCYEKVNDKENERRLLLLPSRLRTSHRPGQRQIANALQRQRLEILSRKRDAPEEPTNPQPSEKRISLANFRSQRAVLKRKSHHEVQRREIAFSQNAKKFRVNVPVTAKPEKQISFQLGTVSTPPENIQATPHPKQDQTASSTPGFSLAVKGTPHSQPEAKNSFDTSHGATRTTPEVQPTTPSVETPVPFVKTSTAVGTPHPKSNATIDSSTVQTTTAANSINKSVSFADAPTPTVYFGQTQAFQFSSSTNPAATPKTEPNTPHPVGLPPTFGTAPAPSFQFGSTPANTPKPGPVNATEPNPFGNTVAPSTSVNSFGGATNPPFGSNNGPSNTATTNTFGSSTQATAANANSFGVSEQTNPFATAGATFGSRAPAATTQAVAFATGAPTTAFNVGSSSSVRSRSRGRRPGKR